MGALKKGFFFFSTKKWHTTIYLLLPIYIVIYKNCNINIKILWDVGITFTQHTDFDNTMKKV